MPLGLGAGFAVLGAGAGPTLVLSAVGTIAVGGLRAVISDAVF
jgi:hypothetical protein